MVLLTEMQLLCQCKSTNWQGVPGRGVSIHNIAASQLGQEALPQTMQIGLATHVTHNLTLMLDVYKDTRFPLDQRIGLYFSPIDLVSFMGGMAREPSKYTAGFSIHLKQFDVNYAFDSHLELGMTHQFSISFFY